MGSFNYVCSITNTPIHEGDEVVLMVCRARNPLEPRANCLKLESHADIGKPIFGTYGDYGKLDDGYINPFNESYPVDRDKIRIGSYNKEDVNMFYAMIHKFIYDLLTSYERISEEELIKVYKGYKTINNEYKLKSSFLNFNDKIITSIDKADNITFNHSLMLRSTSKSIYKDLDKVFSISDESKFIKDSKEIIDYMTFMYNANEAGHIITLPNYGRQDEKEGLHRLIINATNAILEKKIVHDDLRLYVDIKKEDLFIDTYGQLMLPEKSLLKIEDYNNTYCNSDEIRVYIFADGLNNTNIEPITTNDEEYELWEASPKKIADTVSMELTLFNKNLEFIDTSYLTFEDSEGGNYIPNQLNNCVSATHKSPKTEI